MELAPGDPCDMMGVDPLTGAPLVPCDQVFGARLVQLAWSYTRFDFGISTSYHRPVSEVILEAAPNTLLLSGVTLLVSWSVGLLVGITQALRHRRPTDLALSVVGLAIYSMPTFW